MGFYYVKDVYEAYKLPNETVDAQGMAVLLAIAHCMNDVTHKAFPSTATIAEMTHLARSTVFDRLNKLGVSGVLTYKSGGFYDGRQWANTYEIHFPEGFKPCPRKEQPSSDGGFDGDTLSARRIGGVRAADRGSPHSGEEVVRAADTNTNINNKSKNNPTAMGATSPKIFVVGKSFDSHEPRLGIAGELMDFCHTSEESDARTFLSLSIKKGKEATEQLLNQLKQERSAGKLKGVKKMPAYVTSRLNALADKDYSKP